MIHVYLVGNVKRKVEVSSLCGMTVVKISKRRSPSAHKRSQTQETAVIDNDRPKRLNVVVAKKYGVVGH